MGSEKPRGTANYFFNPNAKLQPGCPKKQANHGMCIQFFYAACKKLIRDDNKQLVGKQCKQDVKGCQTILTTSKLNPLISEDQGCFCIETDGCFNYK